MPYRIASRVEIAPHTVRLEVAAPHIARSFRPGQFVMLKHISTTAERIPLSVADVDLDAGTLTLVVMAVGRTSADVVEDYREGDYFHSLLGPLGRPIAIELLQGALVVVGGGFGAAALHPIARAFAAAGTRTVGIVGARTRARLVYRRELAEACDRLLVMTDDGTAGTRGFVTDALERVLAEEKVAKVLSIGPVAMMRAVAEATRPLGIPTLASINPIMVDGTGMCGGCRVTVGGAPRFTCFDGPEFDAHEVDFDDLVQRLEAYRSQEQQAARQRESSRCETDRLLDLFEVVQDARRAQPAYPRREPQVPAGIAFPVPMKHRMKIPRQLAAEQEPAVRIHNFAEVSAGLDPDLALVEASRCIECKDAPCVSGCPVGIDIPEFVRHVRDGDLARAYRVILHDNLFPAICGRVCPQEEQCEARCTIGKKVPPVAIGRLERFVADTMMRTGAGPLPPSARPNGFRVAIVGSGPAGLSCAHELAVRGYRVTIYEALHLPGGVLSYGIPPFRLPREVVACEIDRLRQLGVELRTDHLIGRTLSLEELQAGFDAVFIGTGAGNPTMLNVPGENLKGIYSANEFLIRVNLMHADDFPAYGTPVSVGRRVAVIGGGNTAMDSARVALRLGARSVSVVYRRGREEMPARREEICHASEEGIEFLDFTLPVEFLADENGFVKTMSCVRTESHGEADPSDPQGRRPVREVPGSRFKLDVETVVNAVGFVVNPLLAQTAPGLRTGRKNVILADGEGQTSIDGVFAGGDAIVGGATVISALGQGKRSALAIHARLSSRRESLESARAGALEAN
jgi:glutamate synthase (NADPH/NADH) small chain